MTPQKNEIVVYQPNDIMRIEVRFEDETVWLQQPRIAKLFACSLENVRLHLKNIYANGELDKAATSKESLEVRQEGTRRVTRRVVYYNLDAIISIGYRVNSIVGVRFRQWAFRVTIIARPQKSGRINPGSGRINPESGRIKNVRSYDIKSQDDAVLCAIQDCPGIKADGIFLQVRTSTRSVRRSLERLSGASKIEYRGSKRTGGWYVRT